MLIDLWIIIYALVPNQSTSNNYTSCQVSEILRDQEGWDPTMIVQMSSIELQDLLTTITLPPYEIV